MSPCPVQPNHTGPNTCVCPRQTLAPPRPQFPPLCKPQAGLCCFHLSSILETALRTCLEQSPTLSNLRDDKEVTLSELGGGDPQACNPHVQVCGNDLSQTPLSLWVAALGSGQSYQAGVPFLRVSTQGCWGPFCHSGSGRWGRWIPIYIVSAPGSSYS